MTIILLGIVAAAVFLFVGTRIALMFEAGARLSGTGIILAVIAVLLLLIVAKLYPMLWPVLGLGLAIWLGYEVVFIVSQAVYHLLRGLFSPRERAQRQQEYEDNVTFSNEYWPKLQAIRDKYDKNRRPYEYLSSEDQVANDREVAALEKEYHDVLLRRGNLDALEDRRAAAIEAAVTARLAMKRTGASLEP